MAVTQSEDLLQESNTRRLDVRQRQHRRPCHRESASTCWRTSLRKVEPLRSGRSQATVAQNSRRTVAARAGSWSIHQWPSPSRATVLAPARAAALAAEAALRKASWPGMITNPGAGMAAKSG